MAPKLRLWVTKSTWAIAVFAFVFAASNVFAQGSQSEIEQMRAEREQFIKEIRRVENLNKKYTDEIESIRSQLNEKEGAFDQRMKQLESQLAETKAQEAKKVEKAAIKAQGISPEMEERTYNLLSQSAEAPVDPENEQFREELSKAHYNMGNIFYERGEYQRSVVEYYQAVDLNPYDADIHYNLAFVSGEYIGDQETALKHYQWYLYLKPDAADAPLVKEKMLAAKLHLRSKVDSPIDVDNGHLNLVR